MSDSTKPIVFRKEQTKTAFLGCCITPDQMQHLKCVAERLGIQQSKVVRMALEVGLAEADRQLGIPKSP
jgi:hypothetical protein